MTTTQTLTRPASWQEWQDRTQCVGPKLAASVARGLAYQPQPSDLFISPYAKCGTTWVQQIVHGLRTRGDMNFDDVKGQNGSDGRSSDGAPCRDWRGDGRHLARGRRAEDRVGFLPGFAGGVGLSEGLE